MQMLISALLLAVLIPAGPERPEPTCRAHLQGLSLTTSIQFANGYTLEAPWRVERTRRVNLAQESDMLVELSLDRIVEFDELTGERSATALPQPVHVEVQAPSEPEIVQAAARTWCSTVLKARGANAASAQATLPKPGRIT